METSSQATPGAAPLMYAAGTPPVRWLDYQASRQGWFRTPEAFQWFKRQHEPELTKAGALVIIAGRVFVAVEAFDGCVIAIGKRLAARRAVEAA